MQQKIIDIGVTELINFIYYEVDYSVIEVTKSLINTSHI